jgi:hypothetical protein
MVLWSVQFSHRRLRDGASTDCCPVALVEQGDVCAVSHDCAVEFRNQVFFFSTLRSMFLFLAAPERYCLRVRCWCLRPVLAYVA